MSNLSDKKAAKKIIKTHLYSGSVKQVFKDPNKKVVIVERLELEKRVMIIFTVSSPNETLEILQKLNY